MDTKPKMGTLHMPKRIGMIVPSSNTVVEPICNRIFSGLESTVTVHYARLEVIDVSMDQTSIKQFASDSMLNAARQLAQANVDAIIWNGTAGSWLGLERDRMICNEIEQCTGIKASTASLGMFNCYNDFQIERVHLITPYIKEINDAIVREYKQAGLKTVSVTGLDITDNTAIGSVPTEQLEQLCCNTKAVCGEAIAVVCTNLASAWKAVDIEAKTGALLVDSVTASVREAFHLVGLQNATIHSWGQILSKQRM